MIERKDVLEWDPLLAAPLVRKYEGLRLKAYLCPAGKWTIGYGHTGGVREGQEITKAKAEEILLNDLIRAQDELKSLCRVLLSKGEFVALIDFVFNFGVSKCRNYSLFRELNHGQYAKAGQWIPKYHYAGQTSLNGLITRRNEEQAFFFDSPIFTDAKGRIQNRTPYGE